MGNGKWEMGNGNGKSKIVEIVVNAEQEPITRTE